MLVPKQMGYDKPHHNRFWIIDSLLFIKLICGYTTSIVYVMIDFGLFT